MGTGWFYSVLGGGLTKDPNTGEIANLRPTNNVERVPLSFDNTAERRMRGDFAVPTLFGGNFDAVFNPRSLFRNAISDAIPGWSFHGGTSNIASPTSRLVDWRDIPSLDNYRTLVGYDPAQPNYALKLTSGDSITHNRFVVPDWGTLRFNLHVPNPNGGNLRVSIQGDEPGYENYQPIGNIDLRVADGRVNPGDLTEIAYPIGYPDTDTNRIGYGNIGFETFHVDVPEALRGKSAKLKFELEGNNPLYLDDVFFKSEHLLLGNPTLNGQESRSNQGNHANNYLIERPQYSLSYNNSQQGPNWVSWKLNRSWLGPLPRPAAPWFQPPSNYPGVPNIDGFDYPWIPDNTLPSELSSPRVSRYRTYNWMPGFDRGHLTASENRSRTRKDQLATYFITNALPMQSDFNQSGLWRQLEFLTQNIVEKKGWEVYIMAGGIGSANSQISPSHPLNRDYVTNTSEPINIPDSLWKIMVLLEPGQSLSDITVDTPIISVILPNADVRDPYPDVPDATNWYDPLYITSIKQIEELTNLSLLSNLALSEEEIEEIKEKEYSGPTGWQDFPNV